MASFSGTLRKNDLEGGFWELVCEGGDTYRLSGKGAEGFAAGDKVRVEGKVESGGFGIHMSGPSLDVKSIQAA